MFPPKYGRQTDHKSTQIWEANRPCFHPNTRGQPTTNSPKYERPTDDISSQIFICVAEHWHITDRTLEGQQRLMIYSRLLSKTNSEYVN